MKLGTDEMEHSSHPNHSIILGNHGKPYRCDGCFEVGLGSGFRCDLCNFDIHRECAEATSFTSHRFFKSYIFKFMNRTPGARGRYCDACGRDVKGFVYHCEAKGWDLHPCCANLPEVIQNDEVELHLKEKASSKCHRCGEKKHQNNASGWWYVSSCGEYKFHVACIKDIVVDEWERRRLSNGNEVPERSLVLGTEVLPLQIARRERRGGGYGKYLRILKLVLKIVFSILVGDPTTMFASLVTSLFPNG